MIDKNMPFNVAFPEWLDNHTPIMERTRKCYVAYGAVLSIFFGGMPLCGIDLEQLNAFKQWRWKEGNGAGPESKFRHAACGTLVRNEINGVLKPMMKDVGLWEAVARRFKHLPVPREGSGVALTAAESQQLLEVAFTVPRATLAAHLLAIMYRTGTGVGELRRLRRKDVDLDAGFMWIVLGAKNTGARVRKLVLVPSALESVRWLVRRWEKLGGKNPDDYLMPLRRGIKQADFSMPMTSIHGAWLAIRAKWIQLYNPPTEKHNLRLYDGRVTVASLLLSNPDLSIPTIERTLGWSPSSAMRKRYFRADAETQRAALETLEGGTPRKPPEPPVSEPVKIGDPPAPKKGKIQRPRAAYAAASALDEKLGQLAGKFSPKGLINKLQSLGMDAQTILDVVLASGGNE